MQLLQHSVPVVAVGILSGLTGLASAASHVDFCGAKPGTITSDQTLQGDAFIGAPVSAKPLRPKFKYHPSTEATHMDGGNTRSVDYPGPLGRNLSITSNIIGHTTFYWDAKGTMFSVYGGVCPGETTFARAITIVDPETLEFEAIWQPPEQYANTTLNPTYGQLYRDTDLMVLTSFGGQIYVLKKGEDVNGRPTLETDRLIDVSSAVNNVQLLSAGFDADDNLWFTTGYVAGTGPRNVTSPTTIGYIDKNDTIHKLEIPNQTVENGLSISGTTVFANTGPPIDHGTPNSNPIGYAMALKPGPGTSVEIAWNTTYNAGTKPKQNQFARGGGTSLSLLGNEFAAMTDNTDSQINLLVYRQNGIGENKPICSVPLFSPNASATDNTMVAHFDGKDYGVVVQNMDHQPGIMNDKDQANGLKNNLTVMSPGIQKVFVAGDGSGCHIAWTNPGRMTTPPILSTATGLMYGNEQDVDLANEGQYIWYATAIDYQTGETVWKARTGAGQAFNDGYKTTFLSPNGTFYQAVVGGVVSIRDGDSGPQGYNRAGGRHQSHQGYHWKA